MSSDEFLISTSLQHRSSLRSTRLSRGLFNAWWLVGVLLLLFTPVAQAQVQRSFINLGFEQPDLGSCATSAQIDSATVPGWETTHSSSTGYQPGCGTSFDINGPLIEIWANQFNGYLSGEGTQHAELNARAASRIYQNVCMATGEQVTWSFLHRGRSGGFDVAEFNIDDNSNTVVTARTNPVGGTAYTPADCTSNEGGVTSGSCNAPVQVVSWRRYSGTFTWNGSSGVHNVGFQAISTSGGPTLGNFIDDIRLELLPYVEFSAPSYSIPEQGAATGLPQVRVIGVVPAGDMTIVVNVTGGTAATGTDYTVANVLVPAGDYSAGQLFDVPITIVNDSIVEDNETIQLALQPAPAYVIASTTTCGAPANASSTVVIVDNDVDLRTIKEVSDANPPAGGTTTFTVTFENNTAAPLQAPTTAHDAVAAVSDAVPTGLTFTSWTCAASNGASCPGGTVNGGTSGSGPISGNAILPAGNGAAGGRIVYSITATMGAEQCTLITNISSIVTPVGLTEGDSVQDGFMSPAPGGTANNVSQAQVGLPCADLQISKTNTPEDGPSDQADDIVLSGAMTTYDIVVRNAGPSVAVDAVLHDQPTDGLSSCALASPECSVTEGTATCPVTGTASGELSIDNLQDVGVGGGVRIPSLEPDSAITFRVACTLD